MQASNSENNLLLSQTTPKTCKIDQKYITKQYFEAIYNKFLSLDPFKCIWKIK